MAICEDAVLPDRAADEALRAHHRCGPPARLMLRAALWSNCAAVPPSDNAQAEPVARTIAERPRPPGSYYERGRLSCSMPNDELVLPAPAPTHRLIVVVNLVSSGRRPFMWELWDTNEMRPLQSSYARFDTICAAFQVGSDVCLKRWGCVSGPAGTSTTNPYRLRPAEKPADEALRAQS